MDYYLIRGTKLSLSELYSLSPSGEYYYSGGYNLSAMVALVIGILPVIPGFLQKVGAVGKIPDVYVTIYNNAWFFSFFLAGFVYRLLWNLGGEPGKVLHSSEPLLDPEK